MIIFDRKMIVRYIPTEFKLQVKCAHRLIVTTDLSYNSCVLCIVVVTQFRSDPVFWNYSLRWRLLSKDTDKQSMLETICHQNLRNTLKTGVEGSHGGSVSEHKYKCGWLESGRADEFKLSHHTTTFICPWRAKGEKLFINVWKS